MRHYDTVPVIVLDLIQKHILIVARIFSLLRSQDLSSRVGFPVGLHNIRDIGFKGDDDGLINETEPLHLVRCRNHNHRLATAHFVVNNSAFVHLQHPHCIHLAFVQTVVVEVLEHQVGEGLMRAVVPNLRLVIEEVVVLLRQLLFPLHRKGIEPRRKLTPDLFDRLFKFSETHNIRLFSLFYLAGQGIQHLLRYLHFRTIVLHRVLQHIQTVVKTTTCRLYTVFFGYEVTASPFMSMRSVIFDKVFTDLSLATVYNTEGIVIEEPMRELVVQRQIDPTLPEVDLYIGERHLGRNRKTQALNAPLYIRVARVLRVVSFKPIQLLVRVALQEHLSRNEFILIRVIVDLTIKLRHNLLFTQFRHQGLYQVQVHVTRAIQRDKKGIRSGIDVGFIRFTERHRLPEYIAFGVLVLILTRFLPGLRTLHKLCIRKRSEKVILTFQNTAFLKRIKIPVLLDKSVIERVERLSVFRLCFAQGRLFVVEPIVRITQTDIIVEVEVFLLIFRIQRLKPPRPRPLIGVEEYANRSRGFIHRQSLFHKV